MAGNFSIPARSSSESFRTFRLLALVVLLKPVSNLCLAYGVRHFSSAPQIHPLVLVASLFDPFVAAGVVMQLWWLFSRMSLFSVADLTFVLPVTAVGYMISGLLGRIFLHETVSPARWTGIVLICIGSVLAGTTRPCTTEQAA